MNLARKRAGGDREDDQVVSRRALRGMLVLSLVAASPVYAERDRAADGARTVLGIEVFVVKEIASKERRRWLDAQVAHANQLLAAAGIELEVVQTREIDSRWAHVATRHQRDALGERQRTPGLISLFVVERLDDVDVEGKRLYGVHWRYRRDRRQTWVILSTRDQTGTVLSHELGHLFDLRHSRHRASVMNKRPRDSPPWSERVFVPKELSQIRRHRDRLIDTGVLEPQE